MVVGEEDTLVPKRRERGPCSVMSARQGASRVRHLGRIGLGYGAGLSIELVPVRIRNGKPTSESAESKELAGWREGISAYA